MKVNRHPATLLWGMNENTAGMQEMILHDDGISAFDE